MNGEWFMASCGASTEIGGAGTWNWRSWEERRNRCGAMCARGDARVERIGKESEASDARRLILKIG